MKPLESLRVLTLAINLPGPLAVAQLHKMGAAIVKVEPPSGDPLEHARPDWYEQLHEGQQVVRLNLKEATDRARLGLLLEDTDLLITATRPLGLQRLGLAWQDLHTQYVPIKGRVPSGCG